MGFSEAVAKHALTVKRTSSVEVAMDYILNHPELMSDNFS